jgi:hypothetical protein
LNTGTRDQVPLLEREGKEKERREEERGSRGEDRVRESQKKEARFFILHTFELKDVVYVPL